MLTIAVDAMGGDHAPKSEVEGAIRAPKSFRRPRDSGRPGGRGPRGTGLHPQAAGLPIEIHHASEFITMEDSAAKAVAAKKDSSIRVACRLVRDGDAQGVVSAGNTGAVMATAKMVLGMVRGVDRPALAWRLPHLKGIAGGGGGRGRECRFFAGNAGAVRRDGRDLFAHYFHNAQPARRAAFDRRRRAQGQRSDPRRDCRC